MRPELAALEPKRVFALFDELLNIPHFSGHEEQVAQWLLSFAAKHGFKSCQDEVGNVIIDVPATAGKESTPLCILQSHMDMVAVKAPDSNHDFSRDPLEIKCQDGFISAVGTTLGADDGIGICMILALLEDKQLSHGPLRAIFTVEEETTMKGAVNLKEDYLKADYLINLDSEDTDQMCISCAGSCDVELTFKGSEIRPLDCQGCEVKLTELPGGHSGADIHLGIPNAIMLLAIILRKLSADFDFFIAKAQGGTARNAIPADCSFTLAIPQEQYAEFKNALTKSVSNAQQRYQLPKLKLDCQLAEVTQTLSYAESLELLSLICALPDGVMGMSGVDPLVVETSSNLGLISSLPGLFTLTLMPRSLNNTGLTAVCEKIEALCELTDNCEVAISNEHPCWPATDQSKLRDIILEQFQAVTDGRKMRVTAMHAGIECAQYSQKNPLLEQISIGPTLKNPHSIQERVEIVGVDEIYQTVRRTLSAL